MGRAPCCSKVGLNRGPWTPEEDALLAKHIQAHGEGCWRGLPEAAGLLRCGKSCRLRWVNYLRPTVKRGNISEDEEDLIITLHSLLGNRWSLIAARMPGRTDNEIKNYWNTHLSKKLARKGIDPKTHKRLNSSDPKHTKADRYNCQPLNVLNPMRINEAPITENPNEGSQSALAFLGPHCDHQGETLYAPAPIVLDSEEDFARKASPVRSDDELSKNSSEASSTYGSHDNRSDYSEKVKCLDPVINYYSISSLSSDSLEIQPDRDNRLGYLHLEKPVSISTVYLGPPSSVVSDFWDSSKCTSSSSDCTTSSIRAIVTISSSNSLPPDIENYSNLVECNSLFPAGKFSLSEQENSMIILPSSEMEKVSTHKVTLSDGEYFYFSEDSGHARTLHSGQLFLSDDPIEREIWNCVDKSTVADLGTAEPFTESDFWNVSECSTNHLDFQENLANFEWWLLNFLGSGDEARYSLDHVFQDLYQDSLL
ncbi:hypothetical protein O6H91_15G076300 [Diphasiastrum complanatum]|uniref:Uncharacterized protein n=1 Tax=Diphasiastrum complanatum TaxID=34168 RepID=A0ACC2BJX1_DIPCM|nr:hypothetical protein O6H91_15G076300 [Diphasiastrum complanatum]